jgi:predicted membrane metal-binding protein
VILKAFIFSKQTTFVLDFGVWLWFSGDVDAISKWWCCVIVGYILDVWGSLSSQGLWQCSLNIDDDMSQKHKPHNFRIWYFILIMGTVMALIFKL